MSSGSPQFDGQVGHFLEMRIARDYNQIMLPSCCRDPNVVLWNGPTFDTQLVLDSAVVSRRSSIAADDRRGPCECLDPSYVRFGMARPLGTEVELADRYRRDKHLACSREPRQYGWLGREKCDQNVGIKQN